MAVWMNTLMNIITKAIKTYMIDMVINSISDKWISVFMEDEYVDLYGYQGLHDVTIHIYSRIQRATLIMTISHKTIQYYRESGEEDVIEYHMHKSCRAKEMNTYQVDLTKELVHVNLKLPLDQYDDEVLTFVLNAIESIYENR
jgi:hypothetical protein